jgi:hypothetical protein
MQTLRSRLFPTSASTALAIVVIRGLLIPSGVAAQTEIKGPAILDHPIGKLAVTQMALLATGKFEESLKVSNREYNERYAAPDSVTNGPACVVTANSPPSNTWCPIGPFGVKADGTTSAASNRKCSGRVVPGAS